MKGKAEMTIRMTDEYIRFITPNGEITYIEPKAKYISLWKVMEEIIELINKK